jgi:glycerophosphoryl diester phosphodiesterase
MGHRGAAEAAPENTFAGIRSAALQGAAWVEFDVQTTRDLAPVLFHDTKLERTSDGEGILVERDLNDIRGLDCGAWFGKDFAGEPLPLLEDALALVLAEGLHPNIEVKTDGGNEKELVAATLREIAAHWPADKPPPMISSFSRLCLEEVRAQGSDLPLGYLCRKLPKDGLDFARRLKCDSIHISKNIARRPLIRKIKEAGFEVAVFTVNDPARAKRLLARGADCIITDAPGRILAEVGPGT